MADVAETTLMTHSAKAGNSITSSASTRNDSGIFSPIAVAVLRLTTSTRTIGRRHPKYPQPYRFTGSQLHDEIVSIPPVQNIRQVSQLDETTRGGPRPGARTGSIGATAPFRPKRGHIK
jgi:hypothetical protein